MEQTTLTQHLFSNNILHVFEVELELHSIFWFHTLAQPRDKYVHVSLPIIHNYPLTIAFLGRPVDSSFTSISHLITKTTSSERVWREHGFYIYPAIADRIYTKTIMFSMSGTGYVLLKPKTRAPVPDLTTHQVFMPGSLFKTYIISKSKRPRIPSFVRLGAKRYGVFKIKYKYLGFSRPQENTGKTTTHPFNASECPTYTYYSIMWHHAGEIAFSGIPKKVIQLEKIVLATPKFI